MILKGELSLYAPRGSYQIIVRELQHAGVGELLLKLHELKEELKRRGWLAIEHKKPLPKYPKTIGVVTSPTGSVIQDIIHVLKRRYPTFHLILNPVRVQGKEAAPGIAAAIDAFNKWGGVDVMIVGRGGGSLEDLWPFNEEIVASAIFHSKIPVISAVGHETDVTLAGLSAVWLLPLGSGRNFCPRAFNANRIFREMHRRAGPDFKAKNSPFKGACCRDSAPSKARFSLCNPFRALSTGR